jgi:hypothetical protein
MSDTSHPGNRLARLSQKLCLMRQFFSSLRKRGVWRTLRITIFEIYYEYKFSADTSYIIPSQKLDGADDAKTHATDYFPSSYLVLHEAFSWLGQTCRNAVLVDYGSGMGRTLMYTSTLPLKRLIGVEISKELCAKASANLDRLYRKSKRTSPSWSIVNADARFFDVPDDANLFYFFNPFDEVIMRQVIDSICRSARKVPRKCTIVYANPLHESELTSQEFRKVYGQNGDFAVFQMSPGVLDVTTR